MKVVGFCIEGRGARHSLETDHRSLSPSRLSFVLLSVKPEPDDDATPSSVNSPAAGASKKIRPKIKPKTQRHLDPDGEVSSDDDLALNLNQAVDVDESDDEEVSPDIRGDFIGWDGKEVGFLYLRTLLVLLSNRDLTSRFPPRVVSFLTGPSQPALLLPVPSTIPQLPPHPRSR